MDTHRQIVLSENLKKFQSYVFFLNSSPELEFHLVRNQLPGWFQPGFPPCWTCLNIWVARYSLISISISLSGLYLQFLSQTNWSSELPSPASELSSNSIKASTLVTIKPRSKDIWPEKVLFWTQTEVGGGSVTNNNDHGVRIWRRKSEAREAKQPHFLSSPTSSHSHYNQPTNKTTKQQNQPTKQPLPSNAWTSEDVKCPLMSVAGPCYPN